MKFTLSTKGLMVKSVIMGNNLILGKKLVLLKLKTWYKIYFEANNKEINISYINPDTEELIQIFPDKIPRDILLLSGQIAFKA